MPASMDFHALPRRDLQALCKRNGIRANMTNAAMADALRALPAVDGIEAYVKQPVAEPTPAGKEEEEEREKQGIPLPRGRGVTFKSLEPIMGKDGEEDEGDLKRVENKDSAPALGVGRRGASRRALAEPVVAPATRRGAGASKTKAADVAAEAVPAPATRRRAAASKTVADDVAAEAVPAPTTRPRSQRTAVALVAEEDVPRARRTTRRAAARKIVIQQEEEGEGTQGVVSDVETIVPTPVSDEGCDDPEGMEEAMNPQKEEQIEVVEELSQEDGGSVMDIATPVEEEPLAAEDCTDNSSVQERQVDVQKYEDLPIVLGLVEQEEGAPFRDGTGSNEGPLDEEIHHSSEETKMVPVNEALHATLTAGEATEEAGFTGDAGHASEENEVATSGKILNGTVEANVASMDDVFLLEEMEDLAVDEVMHSADVAVEEEKGVVSGTEDEDAGKESGFTGDIPRVFDTSRDRSDQIASPLFASMLDDVTKPLSTNSANVEPTVSEADDVSLCVYSNSGGERNVTGPVAVEQEKEVKEGNKSEALGNLSLRKLRVKLKETVAVEQEKGVKGGKKSMALDKLSLRKLRIKLKETLIAHKSREPNRVALGRLDENVC